MREFEIGGLARARVWERDLVVAGTRYDRSIAVEMSNPLGGFCEYGLLGASVSLEGPGSCEVRVPVSGPRWHGSWVERIDEVYAALPEEFAIEVLAVGQEAVTRLSFARQLVFDCACHGLVGSNRRTFARLATMLVEIYADPTLLTDDDRMLARLSAMRSGSR